jgi:hypothetical protein
MIAYDSTPSQEINLAVKLVNSGETIATKAIINVMTPDNDRVLFETESNISLDAEGQTVQWDSESVTVQKMSEKLVYFVGEIW